MKKRIICLLMAMTLLLFAGCGSKQAQEEIANPWTDSDAESILALTGGELNAPEDADQITYEVMESEKLGEMTFVMNESTQCCARVQPTDAAEDISGANFDWSDPTECEIYGCSGSIFAAKDGDRALQLCTWYDEETKLSYSLQVEDTDLDGFDIQGLAMQVYRTVKAPVIEDLSSYDAIISQLQPGQAYAFADIDKDHDALLVTSYTYDNLDGNIAAIDAVIYGFGPDGNIMEYGKAVSDGTAYPLAVLDQCLMSGGGHHMMKEYIDEANGSMTTMEYAGETFDESGKACYSYMSLADGQESTPEDNSKLQAMFDEYANATVINFTVVE